MEAVIRPFSDLIKHELELLRILAEAEEDVANGRLAPVQDTFADIRASLLAR